LDCWSSSETEADNRPMRAASMKRVRLSWRD
jgi:hypothetical protein